MNSELTLIIPFLNEGKEVYNTVESFVKTADRDIKIILINDCSTDNYDYRTIAQFFNAIYIEHKERKGVAASRDEGVSICETKYFLMLDAHMRAFQTNWTSTILNAMEDDEKLLLCCATKGLNVDGVIESHEQIGYGAYIDFSDLSVHWIDKLDKLQKNATVVDIPCVLGASYVCEKKYWLYLKGLSGLINYGLDEQLISLKVWQEGGRCKVIKDIAFGHIFRTFDKVPYPTSTVEFVANQFFIMELFGGRNDLIHFYNKRVREVGNEVCHSAINILSQKRNYILEQKYYYQEIFTRKMDYILELNDKMKINGTPMHQYYYCRS